MQVTSKVVLGSLIGLASWGLSLPVHAATTTTRTATVTQAAQPCYSGKTGDLVELSGDLNQVTVTPQKALKTYAKTTWLVTGQTVVTTAKGVATRYVQVKNAQDGVQGWIAQTDLTPGRNYQTDAPVKRTAKNYIKARTGRVYQLQGTRAAMQLVKGQKLSAKQTYRVTQQRYYYRHGVKYLYVHVSSKNETKGWVWHKYLKAGTYYDTAKQQAKIKQRLQTYLDGVTKDGSCMVSFYNLTPKVGSQAAKAKDAKVYTQGKLATNARGHQVIVSASTYKLYISAYLMHLKQQHQFSWTKANTAGMRRMIVVSANDYPVSVLHKYGRAKINHWLGTQGYYGAPFSATHDSVTTANSLVKVLRDLELGKGAFTNKKDRAHILSLMGQQVYRTGMPAGVKQAKAGTTVQDKVGFLSDYNRLYHHDAGIVTLPNGQRYLLAVLTWQPQPANFGGISGYTGFGKVKQITKRVQQIVY
ncbi:Beta-lactamase class A [Lactobacillus zymae] [Lactiplantibacillus mudanjiangensis]|uniref:serine hydrolase n=1 Tax=Lactiplantibacillus mudanjiangensis TaxID=1296538 RepID=UPI001015C17A|nr:Beta-lactamase class A [Lactobacillus zymae] [Lactiplantibacillus mudanjiangensis]